MTGVLIACAHGTRFEEGRVVVRELLEVLRATAPADVEVHDDVISGEWTTGTRRSWRGRPARRGVRPGVR